MKTTVSKILALILSLALLLPCAAFAEAAATEAPAAAADSAGLLSSMAQFPQLSEEQAAELAKITEWLTKDFSQEEAMQVISWDRDTLRSRLEGYDQPLTQFASLDEVADTLYQVFSPMASLFTMAQENPEALGAAITGLAGMGSLMDGFSAEGLPEVAPDEEEGYVIDGNLDGTYWVSGDLALESVWQDGYYKVAILDGDKELSYLCSQDLETGVLTGIGTGVAEWDDLQEDHGIASFRINYDQEELTLIWTKADGSEVVFDRYYDPLDLSQWYTDDKLMTLFYRGRNNYEVNIETLGEEEYAGWIYECVLDSEKDVLTGTGEKNSYAHSFTDSSATFAFTEGRKAVVWTDEKEESAQAGLTLEGVDMSLVSQVWGNQTSTLTVYFTGGYYEVTVMNPRAGTASLYLCALDPATGALTAEDPETFDFDALTKKTFMIYDKKDYTGGAVIERADAEHLSLRSAPDAEPVTFTLGATPD